jgi:hypothetical protein
MSDLTADNLRHTVVMQVQLTRRSFFVGSAAFLAPLGTADIKQPRRNLLSKAWSERITSSLVPTSRFHPLPTVAERARWETIPDDARMALFKKGESQLKAQWEVLPATLFLEFRRDGNRSHYEDVRNRRRTKLQELVIAECVEGKGRFVDEIVDGIWLTCEETFWGVPPILERRKPESACPM